MAEKFQPQTFDINFVNEGNRYQKGDGINADSINSAIEASAYAQALAINQPDISELNGSGNPNVSIIKKLDGTPQLKFANLRGEKGEQGEKGEKGDMGEIEIVRLI